MIGKGAPGNNPLTIMPLLFYVCLVGWPKRNKCLILKKSDWPLRDFSPSFAVDASECQACKQAIRDPAFSHNLRDTYAHSNKHHT